MWLIYRTLFKGHETRRLLQARQTLLCEARLAPRHRHYRPRRVPRDRGRYRVLVCTKEPSHEARAAGHLHESVRGQSGCDDGWEKVRHYTCHGGLCGDLSRVRVAELSP